MAVALAKLAHVLNFTVTIVDPFVSIVELPDADRVLHALDFTLLEGNFDRHVVVASRGASDEEAIEQAVRANSVYVALIANRKRGEDVIRALGMRGITEEKLNNVRFPAGLQIGAYTPEEIAISIMAEIVFERQKRKAEIQARGPKGLQQ
jgi:xanthine dehydrogenase accessory factor